MHERELISLYISGISEKVKSYWPNVSYMIHCSIYATFFVFELWRPFVAFKTHFRSNGFNWNELF